MFNCKTCGKSYLIRKTCPECKNKSMNSCISNDTPSTAYVYDSTSSWYLSTSCSNIGDTSRSGHGGDFSGGSASSWDCSDSGSSSCDSSSSSSSD